MATRRYNIHLPEALADEVDAIATEERRKPANAVVALVGEAVDARKAGESTRRGPQEKTAPYRVPK